jgi:hypothetical protein
MVRIIATVTVTLLLLAGLVAWSSIRGTRPSREFAASFGREVLPSSTSISSSLSASGATSAASISPAGWHTYRNTKYGFLFAYPEDFTVDGGEDAEESDSIVVNSDERPAGDRLPEQLYVYVVTPTDDSEFYFYDLSRGFFTGDFDAVVQQIWQLAREEDGVIGSISTSTIAGQRAYIIRVTKGVGLNGLGRVIDEEHVWAFVKHDNVIFDISLPNKDRFLKIFQTLHFKS